MVNGGVITNNGFKIIMDRTWHADGATTYTAPTKFKVGVGNSEVSITDTDIDTPIPITGTEVVDACDSTSGWSAGTDSAVSLNTTRYKEGTGSLSLAKSGTAGTVMSMSKTTTSRDFATSKYLWLWVYIADLTDLVSSGTAVVVRFGSDGSNYYYKNVDISSLAAGWNYITFSSATATGTTGTPTIGSCDYTYIAFNTDLAADTIAADRVLVDDLKLASDDDYAKAFETGYPAVTETTKEVEVQCYLASTQAYGHEINGFGIVNTDASPILFSEDTFTGESKSQTDEFLFVIKDRFL